MVDELVKNQAVLGYWSWEVGKKRWSICGLFEEGRKGWEGQEGSWEDLFTFWWLVSSEGEHRWFWNIELVKNRLPNPFKDVPMDNSEQVTLGPIFIYLS